VEDLRRIRECILTRDPEHVHALEEIPLRYTHAEPWSTASRLASRTARLF